MPQIEHPFFIAYPPWRQVKEGPPHRENKGKKERKCGLHPPSKSRTQVNLVNSDIVMVSLPTFTGTQSALSGFKFHPYERQGLSPEEMQLLADTMGHFWCTFPNYLETESAQRWQTAANQAVPSSWCNSHGSTSVLQWVVPWLVTTTQPCCRTFLPRSDSQTMQMEPAIKKTLCQAKKEKNKLLGAKCAVSKHPISLFSQRSWQWFEACTQCRSKTTHLSQHRRKCPQPKHSQRNAD